MNKKLVSLATTFALCATMAPCAAFAEDPVVPAPPAENEQVEATADIDIIIPDELMKEAQESKTPITLKVDPVKVVPRADAKDAPVINLDVPDSVTAQNPIDIIILLENPCEWCNWIILDENDAEDVGLSVPTEKGIRFRVKGDSRFKVLDNNKEFVDIDGHWAEKSINFVTGREILKGVGNDRFAPNVKVNRAMVTQMLYNIADNPQDQFDNRFIDVPADAWFANSVNWAANKGFVMGVGDNCFAPEDNISRQDFIMILHRFAGSPKMESTACLDRFSDKDSVASYAKEAMAWAVDRGFIMGTPDGRLNPTGETSRAELSKIIGDFIMADNQTFGGFIII